MAKTPTDDNLSDRITFRLSPTEAARLRRQATRLYTKDSTLARRGVMELVEKLEKESK